MGLTTFSGPVESQNGFIETPFTTAQRDAIVAPTAGLLIYNSTTSQYEVYTGSAWQAAFGGGGPVTLTDGVDGTFSADLVSSGSFAISNPSVTAQTEWTTLTGKSVTFSTGSGPFTTTITVSGSMGSSFVYCSFDGTGGPAAAATSMTIN